MSYYVYAHFIESRGIFYIGKGKGRRAYSKQRNNYWKSVVEKNNGEFSVIFLHTDIESEEHAFFKEIEEIKKAKEMGFKLCNLTDGGGTPYVYTDEVRTRIKERTPPWTDERRRKHSERMKGNTFGEGRIHSEQERLLRSSKTKGLKKPEGFSEKIRQANLGKKKTEESKKKMSESAKNRGQNNCLIVSGVDNIAADKNIYKFINIETGEVRFCTRCEMSWLGKNLKCLFRKTKKAKTYKGWRVEF